MAEKSDLDMGQIGPVLLVLFANFFSSMIVFPFVPFMVKDFLDVSRARIGFYSGFIISVYHAGVLLGSVIWGSLADRWGRRPTILASLSLMLVFMLLFGFSQSFAWAIVTRLLWGFSASVMSIGKTILSESTSNANTPRVFSFLGVASGLGRIFGPAAGGLLSQPAKKFPALDTPFFRKFPYILPIFVSSSIVSVAFVWAFFYLRETLPQQPPSPDDKSDDNKTGESIELLEREEPDDVGSEDGTGGNGSSRCSVFIRLRSVCCCVPSGGFQRMTDEASAPQTSQGYCLYVYSGIKGCFSALSLLRDKVIRHSATLYGLLSLVGLMHNELVPLLLVVSYAHGGLCMNTAEIGIITVGIGFLHMTFQLFMFPRIVKRFGYRRVFRGGLLVFAAAIVLMPFLVNFTGNQDPDVVYDDVYESVSVYRNSSSLYTNTTATGVDDVCVRHVTNSTNVTVSACGSVEGAASHNTTRSSTFQFSVIHCLPWRVWVISLAVLGLTFLGRQQSFTTINVIINNSCERGVRARVNAVAMAVSSVGKMLGPLVVSNLFAWSVSETHYSSYPLNHHLSFLVIAILSVLIVLWSWGLPSSVETKKAAPLSSSSSSRTCSSSSVQGSGVGAGLQPLPANHTGHSLMVTASATAKVTENETNL